MRRERLLAASPARAEERWSDPGGWPGRVDGLRGVETVDAAWPAPGGRVRWRSGPDGRGTVEEECVEHERGRRLVVRFADDRMTGVQRAEFSAVPGGSRLALEFDYRVSGAGPVGRLIDLLFVRRVVGEMLDRTLDGFAAEFHE